MALVDLLAPCLRADRHTKYVAAIGFAVFLATCAANAGERPEKPLHVIVPWGGGSLADLVPRIIYNEVSRQSHQPIVVENRPGAGGTIGAALVARSNPDGYTVLVNSNAQVNAPLLYAKLPYDPSRDLTAVALLVIFPDALIVASSKRIGSLAQFVRTARERSDGLTFATFGVGSASHMGAERFRLAARYEATQVPFKGAPEAIREVMEGRVDFCFCGVGTSLPFIRDGRLTALAISTPKRTPLLPDVPTTLEAGYPDSDYTPWIGLFAPARTPPAVIRRLHDDVVSALNTTAVRDKLAAVGTEPVIMSSADFAAFTERDAALSKRLVEALGLKPH